jgi:hypothetical protein
VQRNKGINDMRDQFCERRIGCSDIESGPMGVG